MKGGAQMEKKHILPCIAGGILCVAAAAGILLFPQGDGKNVTMNLSEVSSVNTICELATLKSFYHNVAMFEKKPDGSEKFMNDIFFWPFGNVTKVGYKQFWIEYNGIVETGVDADKIQILGPDRSGVVEVYVPDARVLGVNADENSLTEPLSEKGWFTQITGREKAEAFASAQSAMRQEAENNRNLLMRSKENAKVLLERYIVETGKETGMELKVHWNDSPIR